MSWFLAQSAERRREQVRTEFLGSEILGRKESSYGVLHSRSLFAQPLAFLPAHFLQHFSAFIDLADLPLRKTKHRCNAVTTRSNCCAPEYHLQMSYYSWTEAGASSRWNAPSLPTAWRRDSARFLYLGFFMVLASSLLCFIKKKGP